MSAESLQLLRNWLAVLALNTGAIALAVVILAAVFWPCLRQRAG